MRWATLSHVHLDRVAAPWLIRRFVDPDATFEFVDWGADGQLPTAASITAPPGACPVGMPGVELGLHDADGTCFAKVLRVHGLTDPALRRMERIVAAGVSHALGTAPNADETEEERVLGSALDTIGAALGVAFDDAEHLDRALPLYDAIYLHCRVAELPAEVRDAAPWLPPQRTPFLRQALERARTPTSSEGVPT